MSCSLQNLKEVKSIKPKVYAQTFSWIKKLNKKEDKENGKKFKKFINKNLKLHNPLGTCVLVKTNPKEVIGIISLVKDDQNAGKEKKICGVWIAGVVIKKEFRGKGYGKKLMKLMDNKLKRAFRKTKTRVNLFANSKIAIKIYQRIGFKSTKITIKRNNSLYKIYSKQY